MAAIVLVDAECARKAKSGLESLAGTTNLLDDNGGVPG